MRGRAVAWVIGFVAVMVLLLLLATAADAPGPPRRASLAPVLDRSDDPAPTSTTTTTTVSSTTTVPPRSATITFSGDVLLHSRVWREAASAAIDDDTDGYDFRPMFEAIEPLIAGADWSVCHLEVNLDADNASLSSFPVFRGPGAIAADLAEVGFDACSTASNHSLDGGTTATFETIDVLEEAGLRAIGTARSAEEAAAATQWIEIEGIRIAHLAYAYWFNGFELPDDQPWAANQIDENRILADARQARSAGAEFVMVSMHWGDQYRPEPNAMQADLGPRLLASDDIDLLVGHHAHVVQPIERVDGEWLVYGVGNLLSNQTQLLRRDELIVSVTIEEQGDGTFEVDWLEVIPVFVDQTDLTIWPSGPAARTRAPASLVPALEASFERVVGVLSTGSGWSELEIEGR